nr:putative extracellular protein CSOL_103 [Pseudococcomyxa simplex]
MMSKAPYRRSALLLAALCLATAAHGGVDSNGQDWGVLTKTRAELLGIAPAPAPSPCLGIDAQCMDCFGAKCTACNYPFIVGNNKCVCPKGLTLTNDTSTCIDMGIVDVGKKVYNDPTLKKGINQTQIGLQKISNQFLTIASKGVQSFIARETKDITAAAASALAPLGLAVAPGPVPAAGAPGALPGSAVAGQPSITQPFAESPIAGVAEAPAGLIPAQAPIVSLQELGGTKAATASATALQPIESLLSQAGGLLPSLFSGLGRKMLRAE